MKTESQLIEIETVKPKIVVYTDISYSQPYDPYFGITNLKLDILKPEVENKKLPLVIYIPGGGFMRSPKANYIQQKVTIGVPSGKRGITTLRIFLTIDAPFIFNVFRPFFIQKFSQVI